MLLGKVYETRGRIEFLCNYIMNDRGILFYLKESYVYENELSLKFD